MKKCVLLVLLCGLCRVAPAAGASALSHSEILGLFNEGTKLFHEANDLAATDPDAACDMYRKSAMRFERIVRDGGIENGRLYYNIGNAYFRSKDLGRAILNYRRAEQHIPNDVSLQQNLAYARARRMDKIEMPPKKRVFRTLFFWHYDISAKGRSMIFAVCFIAFWTSAGARLFIKRPFLIWSPAILGLLSVGFLASLFFEMAYNRSVHPGVVVQEEIIARKGDSETYEPSFKEPLHAGTEFTLIENRGEWCYIRLDDGRTSWLPVKSVELVR